MRFLLDANLSPRGAAALRDAGHEARHVQDLGLLTAQDQEILDRAAAEGDVIVTADADFAMLLAVHRAVRPSVIHLRHVAELSWQAHVELLLANLSAILGDLEAGAVVSLSPQRLAVRRLPIT